MATNPKPNKTRDPGMADGESRPSTHSWTAEGLRGRKSQPMDVSTAYRIAGVVVATHHSRFHHLDGSIMLPDGKGLEDAVRMAASLDDRSNGVRTLTELAGQVAEEYKVLCLAGRQAELMHLTLNAPANLDQQLADLVKVPALSDPVDHGHGREFVSEALGMVTGHWHEIECLAAWLSRQQEQIIDSREMMRVIERIRPGDHGLFP